MSNKQKIEPTDVSLKTGHEQGKGVEIESKLDQSPSFDQLCQNIKDRLDKVDSFSGASFLLDIFKEIQGLNSFLEEDLSLSADLEAIQKIFIEKASWAWSDIQKKSVYSLHSKEKKGFHKLNTRALQETQDTIVLGRILFPGSNEELDHLQAALQEIAPPVLKEAVSEIIKAANFEGQADKFTIENIRRDIDSVHQVVKNNPELAPDNYSQLQDLEPSLQQQELKWITNDLNKDIEALNKFQSGQFSIGQLKSRLMFNRFAARRKIITERWGGQVSDPQVTKLMEQVQELVSDQAMSIARAEHQTGMNYIEKGQHSQDFLDVFVPNLRKEVALTSEQDQELESLIESYSLALSQAWVDYYSERIDEASTDLASRRVRYLAEDYTHKNELVFNFSRIAEGIEGVKKLPYRDDSLINQLEDKLRQHSQESIFVDCGNSFTSLLEYGPEIVPSAEFFKLLEQARPQTQDPAELKILDKMEAKIREELPKLWPSIIDSAVDQINFPAVAGFVRKKIDQAMQDGFSPEDLPALQAKIDKKEKLAYFSELNNAIKRFLQQRITPASVDYLGRVLEETEAFINPQTLQNMLEKLKEDAYQLNLTGEALTAVQILVGDEPDDSGDRIVKVDFQSGTVLENEIPKEPIPFLESAFGYFEHNPEMQKYLPLLIEELKKPDSKIDQETLARDILALRPYLQELYDNYDTDVVDLEEGPGRVWGIIIRAKKMIKAKVLFYAEQAGLREPISEEMEKDLKSLHDNTWGIQDFIKNPQEAMQRRASGGRVLEALFLGNGTSASEESKVAEHGPHHLALAQLMLRIRDFLEQEVRVNNFRDLGLIKVIRENIDSMNSSTDLFIRNFPSNFSQFAGALIRYSPPEAPWLVDFRRTYLEIQDKMPEAEKVGLVEDAHKQALLIRRVINEELVHYLQDGRVISPEEYIVQAKQRGELNTDYKGVLSLLESLSTRLSALREKLARSDTFLTEYGLMTPEIRAIIDDIDKKASPFGSVLEQYRQWYNRKKYQNDPEPQELHPYRGDYVYYFETLKKKNNGKLDWWVESY